MNLLDLLIKIAIAVMPVLLFLVTLMYLDSYKLVKFRRVLVMMLVGCGVAIVSYGLNVLLLDVLEVSRTIVTRTAAPIMEETLKCLLIFVLIRARRIGFLVDAAIQGFAIGTGFALVENFYYVIALPDASVALWMIRGLGTAVMHGGTTAIFAIISKGLTQKITPPRLYDFVPGLLLAFGFHAAFNHFVVSPLISTILVVIVLPVVFTFFFHRSEKRLQNWLGSGFDLDTEILRLINSGDFTKSPIGLYLKSLRQFYAGEVLADMLCYLRLRTELALRAKGVLMMRESGFPVKPDPEVKANLEELRYLETTIGRTAMMSLTPIVRSSEQDMWQLEILQEA